MAGLRIIAGSWRGRLLESPRGNTTRPTASRARETLFSMLASRMGGFTDLRVADLFAGSGALGLEALSRGAAHCHFVERDAAAVGTLRVNLARLGSSNQSSVTMSDAVSFTLPPPAFDLIFIDPPYGAVDLEALIARLLAEGQLTETGLISAETDARSALCPAGARLIAERKVGKARLHLFGRAD